VRLDRHVNEVVDRLTSVDDKIRALEAKLGSLKEAASPRSLPSAGADLPQKP
jgi:hypothetical protein